MHILVFGLGALGHVFAGLLQKGGHEVIAIGRQKIVEVVQQKGIFITGIWGEHQVRLKGVYTEVNKLPQKNFDLILLTVKSYDTKAALLQLKSIVNVNTLVICVQNGLGNYETAVEIIGKKHVALARVIFGAELLAPGEVKVTVCAGDVIIGSPQNVIPKDQLETLAQVFTKTGIPTRYSQDIVSYLWDKVLYNCALNALGAILEVNYGKLGEILPLREIMEDIVKEIFLVAQKHKIPLFWPSAKAYLEHFYQKLLPPTAAHYPSMLQDILKGKKTEIDALNGAIVKLGKKVGIPTPINLFITRLIKGKEQICSLKKN